MADQVQEPESVTAARRVVEDWERYRVCPMVRKAKFVCVWHCYECKRAVRATQGSVSTGDYGQSRVASSELPNGVRCALVSPYP